MFKPLRRRPSGAMCVASVALFAALGGVGIGRHRGSVHPRRAEHGEHADGADDVGQRLRGRDLQPEHGSQLDAADADRGARSRADEGQPVDEGDQPQRRLARRVNATAFLRHGVATSPERAPARAVSWMSPTRASRTASWAGRRGIRRAACTARTPSERRLRRGRTRRPLRRQGRLRRQLGERLGRLLRGPGPRRRAARRRRRGHHRRRRLGGDVSCAGCVGPEDISGKVADADKLDGIDSTALMQGRGGAAQQAVAMVPGQAARSARRCSGACEWTTAAPSSSATTARSPDQQPSGRVRVHRRRLHRAPRLPRARRRRERQLPAAPNGES